MSGVIQGLHKRWRRRTLMSLNRRARNDANMSWTESVVLLLPRILRERFVLALIFCSSLLYFVIKTGLWVSSQQHTFPYMHIHLLYSFTEVSAGIWA